MIGKTAQVDNMLTSANVFTGSWENFCPLVWVQAGY